MTPTGPRLRTQPQRTDAWYVTASHRVMRPHANGQREVPFDVGHLRQVGAAFTACGKPAMHWQIFWDLPAGEVETLCPQCSAETTSVPLRADSVGV
jgi:hypothetical protein